MSTTKPKVKKVIIADDHSILAAGIASLIASNEGYEVVAIVEDGERLIKQIEVSVPDLVIVDINMPNLNGLEASKIIKERFSRVKIIILSMYDKEGYIHKALEMGVDGYLLKNADFSEIKMAMERVLEGKTYFSMDITDKMVKQMRSHNPNENLANITPTETKILNLLSQGLTTGEISRKMGITDNTVNAYKKNLFNKFDARNMSHLISKAISRGYIIPDDATE